MEEDKIGRMKNLHKELRQTQKQRDRLMAKLEEVIEHQGIKVDANTNDNLCSITQSEAVKLKEVLPPDTIQHVFWEQQVDALSHITHFVKASPGFSAEMDRQLMDAAIEEWQKYVILLLDEMHIREDLIYEKNIGTLIGFTNLGEVNNLLLAFECAITYEESSPLPLSKTFMFCGFFTSLHFPYVALCKYYRRPSV